MRSDANERQCAAAGGSVVRVLNLNKELRVRRAKRLKLQLLKGATLVAL